jgi:hypothetical protein
VITAADAVLDLLELEGEQLPLLSDLRHPVTAYLNGLAASSRRTQLSGLGPRVNGTRVAGQRARHSSWFTSAARVTAHDLIFGSFISPTNPCPKMSRAAHLRSRARVRPPSC